MFSVGRLSNAFRIQAVRFGRVTVPSVQNTFQLAQRFSTVPEVEQEAMPILPLRRGDEIKVKILQFGPLGASASINDDTGRGLILQSEVQYAEKRRAEGDIKVGEHLKGYVERVREDGKVDISLRPVDVLRIEVLKNELLETLKKAVNGTIEVGDKSPPERIAKVMNGMSKTDFKNAVGALYKEGLVRPSKLWVKLIPPENLEESKRKARKALEAQILMRESEKKEKYRQDKLNQLKQKGLTDEEGSGSDGERENDGKRERNEECCLFVGNLPPNIEPKLFIHAVESKILPENIVNIRLCRDQNGLSRGFGYVELVNESLVDASIEILKGHVVGGRKLRVDYANPEKRYIVKARTEREFGPDSPEARRRRGSDVLPPRARRGLLNERAVSPSASGNEESVAKVGDWMPRYNPVLPHEVAKPSRHHPRGDNYDDTPARNPVPRTRTGHVDPTKPAFEASLYFGNLPFDATKEDLEQEIINSKCIRAEDIASARIIMDRETGLSKGFGYVDLYTAEAAEKVYEELHNHEFRGRPMKIDDATR